MSQNAARLAKVFQSLGCDCEADLIEWLFIDSVCEEFLVELCGLVDGERNTLADTEREQFESLRDSGLELSGDALAEAVKSLGASNSASGEERSDIVTQEELRRLEKKFEALEQQAARQRAIRDSLATVVQNERSAFSRTSQTQARDDFAVVASADYATSLQQLGHEVDLVTQLTSHAVSSWSDEAANVGSELSDWFLQTFDVSKLMLSSSRDALAPHLLRPSGELNDEVARLCGAFSAVKVRHLSEKAALARINGTMKALRDSKDIVGTDPVPGDLWPRLRDLRQARSGRWEALQVLANEWATLSMFAAVVLPEADFRLSLFDKARSAQEARISTVQRHVRTAQAVVQSLDDAKSSIGHLLELMDKLSALSLAQGSAPPDTEGRGPCQDLQTLQALATFCEVAEQPSEGSELDSRLSVDTLKSRMESCQKDVVALESIIAGNKNAETVESLSQVSAMMDRMRPYFNGELDPSRSAQTEALTKLRKQIDGTSKSVKSLISTKQRMLEKIDNGEQRYTDQTIDTAKHPG